MQKASKSGREKVGLTTVEVFLQMCCLSTSIFERPRLFLCLQHAPITKPIYTQNSEEPIKHNEPPTLGHMLPSREECSNPQPLLISSNILQLRLYIRIKGPKGPSYPSKIYGDARRR